MDESIKGCVTNAVEAHRVNAQLKQHIEAEKSRSALLNEEADGERACDQLAASAAAHLEEYEGGLVELDAKVTRHGLFCPAGFAFFDRCCCLPF